MSASAPICIGDLSSFRLTSSVFGGAAAGPPLEPYAWAVTEAGTVHARGAPEGASPRLLGPPPFAPAPVVLTRLKPAVAVERVRSSAAGTTWRDGAASAEAAVGRRLAGAACVLATTSAAPWLGPAAAGSARGWLLCRLLAGRVTATGGERPRWVVWGGDHDAVAVRTEPTPEGLRLVEVRRLPGWGARAMVTGLAAILEEALPGSPEVRAALPPPATAHLRALATVLAERVLERSMSAPASVTHATPLVAPDLLQEWGAPAWVMEALGGWGVRVSLSVPTARLKERVETRTLAAPDQEALRKGGLDCVVPGELDLVHPRLVALLRGVATVTEVGVAQALGFAERGIGGKHLTRASVSLPAWGRWAAAPPEEWPALDMALATEDEPVPPPASTAPSPFAPRPAAPRPHDAAPSPAPAPMVAASPASPTPPSPAAALVEPRPGGAAPRFAAHTAAPAAALAVAPPPIPAAAPPPSAAAAPPPLATAPASAAPAPPAASPPALSPGAPPPDAPAPRLKQLFRAAVKTATLALTRSEEGTAPQGAETPPATVAPSLAAPPPLPATAAPSPPPLPAADARPRAASVAAPPPNPAPSPVAARAPQARTVAPPVAPVATPRPPAPVAAGLPQWGRFPLSFAPDLSTVKVHVDGALVDASAWVIEEDEGGACLRFVPGRAPPFGALVRVDYRPAPEDAS